MLLETYPFLFFAVESKLMTLRTDWSLDFNRQGSVGQCVSPSGMYPQWPSLLVGSIS